MKINRLFAIVALAVCAATASAQYNMPTQTFTYDKPYAVEKIKAPKGKKVKNVILMIGDGMSLMHVYTAWTANRGKLWLENATATGLSKTWATNKLVTDSGSGGTSLATGVKTCYHAVGVDPEGKPLTSLVDVAKELGRMRASPSHAVCGTLRRAISAAITSTATRKKNSSATILQVVSTSCSAVVRRSSPTARTDATSSTNCV